MFSKRIGPCIKTVKFLNIEFLSILIINVLKTRKYFNSFLFKSCSILIQSMLFKEVP